MHRTWHAKQNMKQSVVLQNIILQTEHCTTKWFMNQNAVIQREHETVHDNTKDDGTEHIHTNPNMVVQNKT